MKSTVNWKHLNLVGISLIFLVIIITPTVVHAQNTDTMLTNYIEILNANMPPNSNGAAVADLFTEDGIHHGVNQGPPQKGREEIGKFFAGFENRWVDWAHVEKSRVIQDNHAVWEGTAQGNHKETGKFVELPIVFVLEFDEQGKVKENRVYVDVHLVSEQLK